MISISILHVLLILACFEVFPLFSSALSVQHICMFDQFINNKLDIRIVEELSQENSGAMQTYTAVSLEEEWQPIRIRVSTGDLNDANRYCTKEGKEEGEKIKKNFICTKEDIFTTEKKAQLQTIIRSAIQMHADRLKVRPIKHGFKIPDLRGGMCSRLTLPEEHKTKGVMDVDFVLIVGVFTKELSDKNMDIFALSSPCAQLSNGRPVVGGLFYKTSRITLSAYTVRVAAHQIAHVLTFSSQLLKDTTTVKITSLNQVRGKIGASQISGAQTLASAKSHYGCSDATGMELEDEISPFGGRVSHSHWKRRNARDELMATIVERGYYTALTLSVFEDTNFFKAEMSKAEKMEWGANAGCEFLKKPCITGGKTEYPEMFCTNTDATKKVYGCTADGRGMGLCTNVVHGKVDVDTPYRYFTDIKVSGSALIMTDRCPIFERESYKSCQIKDDNLPGVTGPDSVCLSKAKDSPDVSQSDNTHYEGMCVKLEKKANEEITVTYGDKLEAKCNGGKVPLGSSHSNSFLKCPSILKSDPNDSKYASVLLQQDTVAEENMEVKVYVSPFSPNVKADDTKAQRNSEGALPSPATVSNATSDDKSDSNQTTKTNGLGEKSKSQTSEAKSSTKVKNGSIKTSFFVTLPFFILFLQW